MAILTSPKLDFGKKNKKQGYKGSVHQADKHCDRACTQEVFKNTDQVEFIDIYRPHFHVHMEHSSRETVSWAIKYVSIHLK